MAGGRFRKGELIAMVLGFIVFWPVGLAILAWMLMVPRDTREEQTARWGAKISSMWHSGEGRCAERFQERMARKQERWAMKRERWMRRHGMGGGDWRPGSYDRSGNTAFDDWKAAELARLEEERKRLEDAQREFSSFLDDLKRAKDREEFDRFMAARKAQQEQQNQQPPHDPNGDPFPPAA
ncbi:MAG: DUF2852 domain-containing protein [Alphaproteobacteria bacterium]|nr:DUF2852 domain-containing protein [Alphaproteobacteria bacterium]